MLCIVLSLLFIYWHGTLLLMPNTLSQGLLKTSVFKVGKLCHVDACGDRCLLIAVYNSWGSAAKQLTSVVSELCVEVF